MDYVAHPDEPEMTGARSGDAQLWFTLRMGNTQRMKQQVLRHAHN